MMAAGWPAEASRFFAMRLGPGADLRGAVCAAFNEVPETAGFTVACVGSLSRAALRYAGQNAATVTQAPFEIASLSGTFSVDGCHLHAVLSGADGATLGGHVMAGCIVRTTAELILGLTDAITFTRPVDPATGYGELSVTPPGK